MKYSVIELADIFGVSVQKIHDWLKSGRFVGLENLATNQHLGIPESTLWKARNGRVYLLSEFVKEWADEKAKKHSGPVTAENEHEFLAERVSNFENKYGGNFDVTLGRKDLEDMTAQEESDASMWKYFLVRLEVSR